MIPKILCQMLVGRAPQERRQRSRPMPTWTTRQGATHVADGQFETEEWPTPPGDPIVIEPVDQAVAEALAEEARQLSRVKPTTS